MPHAEDEAELVEQPRRPRLRQFAQVDAKDAAIQERQRRTRLRPKAACGLAGHPMCLL